MYNSMSSLHTIETDQKAREAKIVSRSINLLNPRLNQKTRIQYQVYLHTKPGTIRRVIDTHKKLNQTFTVSLILQSHLYTQRWTQTHSVEYVGI